MNNDTDLLAIMAQRKLNAQATRVEVPVAFLAKFPDMKPDKADKLFHKYLSVVMETLIGRLPFLRDGATYVSTEDLLHKCGEFQYKKKRYFVWKELKDMYPFMVVLEKGSNLKATDNPFEKNTKVKVANERLLEMMLHGKSARSVFWHFYTPEDMSAAEGVAIDMDNLGRYIGCTEFELERAVAPKLRAKLQGNLWQAMLVQKIGQFTEEECGSAVLPMIPIKSPFGRTYYKGLNIQNVSKQVRSAIIGRHFQYDMNAAVFAIKLFLYGSIMGGDNAIAGTMLGTYTRQYLAEKNAIRNRLARYCFDGIDIPHDSKVKGIKNALTAIGFGAKTGGKSWMGPSGMQGTALADILTAPSVRAAFLDDAWVKAFLDEQRVMEEAILADAETREGYDEMCEAIRDSNGANGRVTRGGKLAFMYQNYETHIMDMAVSALRAEGIEPIARIHDAFIVRDKLPARVLDEVHAVWGFRGYLSLDCEEVGEWIEADYKRAIANAEQEQAEHQERMRKADVLARMYAIKKAGL